MEVEGDALGRVALVDAAARAVIEAAGYGPGLKGKLPTLDPLSYPETALFHPAAPEPWHWLQLVMYWQYGMYWCCLLLFLQG